MPCITVCNHGTKKVHWCTHFHDILTQNTSIYSEASDSRSTLKNAL